MPVARKHLTFVQATALRAELARIERAKPTTLQSFTIARAARKAEIERTLASAEIEPEPFVDERAEACMRSSAGGDRFGR